MKKIISVAFVLTLVALAADLSAGERQGPRISVPEPRFDFGTVSPGSQAEHLFEIRNTGDELLEIQRVQPT